MSRSLRMAAMMLEATSGSEVPRATMVRPMTSSLTPMSRANTTAPSTNQREPRTSNTRPPTTNTSSSQTGWDAAGGAVSLALAAVVRARRLRITSTVV